MPESQDGDERPASMAVPGRRSPSRKAGGERALRPDSPPRVDDELRLLLRGVIEEMAARRSVTAGERPLVLDLDVDGLRCLVLVEARIGALHPALSPREHEIAHMVGQGYPNKTIAAILGISSWTVSTHLRRMFAKLGVRSRAELVARVIEEEFGVEELRRAPGS